MAKYLWNTRLCESLYPCFQLLEVTFRNKLHSEIGIAAKDPTWLINEVVSEEERTAIKEAKESLALERCPITEDYLVAEMKFGFWTTLLNSKYEMMWRKIIVGVFPNMPKHIRTRREASSLMNKVRRLRNAAMHHHSIWHWGDLFDRHKEMRTLISYMCKYSELVAQETDRFPDIYANGVGGCQKIVAKILESIQDPAP